MTTTPRQRYIPTTLALKIPVGAPILLDQLIAHYLATEFIGKSPLYLARASQVLSQFDRWIAGRPLIKGGKVDLALFQAWITNEHQRVQGTTASLHIGLVVAFLNWLVLHGILESDTHRLAKKPRVPKKPPRLRITLDEYERMKVAALNLPGWKSIGSAYWALVCGWNLGQSFVDCSLLEQKNVDLDEMMITVVRQKTRKSNATARIHIQAGSDFHVALLERMKSKDPHYPNNPATGTYYLDTYLAAEAKSMLAGIDAKRLGNWWKKIRVAAGVDKRKTFHCLRASMCSMLVNNGVNPIVACQITGHTDLKSLAGYATVDESTIHEAFVSARRSQAVKESIVTQAKALNASPVTQPQPVLAENFEI